MMMLLERSQWANSYATDGVIYLGVSDDFFSGSEYNN